MQPHAEPPFEPRIIGRYALYDEIAAGGMATVHFGRLLGEAGFSRTVAIKRLHPQYAKDPDFVSMFVDEARVAARVHHPNVVSTLDVVFIEGELFLVMEYVMGESLSKLIPMTRAAGQRIPPAVAGTVMAGVLHGLHAAHEARDERGVPLGIVHRDVSPQNVLVGVDGTARVLDFGVAKAVGRIQTTKEGQLKGKIAYMAPEQIRGVVDRTTDVYAASVVLWETLTGRRLFMGDSEVEAMGKVLAGCTQPPSAHAPDVPPALDAITMRGLDLDPTRRFQTAGEMALAIEEAVPLVAASRIGRWVSETAAQRIAARTERIHAMESSSAIRGPREQQPSGGFQDYASGSRPVVTAASPQASGTTVAVPAPAAARFAVPPTAPARSKAAVPIAVIAGLLTIAVPVAGLLVWRSAHTAPVVVPGASAASTVAAPAVPPLDSAMPAASADEGSPSATVSPAESSAPPIATVPVSALPAATVPRAQGPARGAPAVGASPARSAGARTGNAPPAHPAVDCNPPYYFNAHGDKIFKQECL